MPYPDSSSFISVETLYTRHNNWLRTWLRQKLGCSQQAADLAQDTFVRVLLRRDPITNSAPRALLSTIARGLVIDHWRRSALERAWLEALAQVPGACYPSAEQQQITMQSLERVARLLDGLKARSRNAFLLHQLAGLSYPEIAARLQVSTRTVERDVAAALLQCYRACYEES